MSGLVHSPGDVAPPSQEWSDTVSGLIDAAVQDAVQGANLGNRPLPFYNSLDGLESTSAPVTWSALSGTLGALTHLSEEERWEIADRARLQPVAVPGVGSFFGQDEYCEWSATRNERGEITRVTFTTEVGEWFEHLAKTDRGALLATYSEMFETEVEEKDLFSGGSYNGRNEWNSGADGHIAHLAQENNNLDAAIRLAAEASVVRTGSDGNPITDASALMRCNGLGNARRFSDPSIATTINAAAIGGARIALADPPGLYLTRIRTDGMRLPPGHEGLKPSDLWKPKRGKNGRVVRACFEPPENSFTLSEVLLDGRPIVTGAQLAERVEVSISALVHPAGLGPVSKVCG